ncbi:MAG: hypothetical protein LBT47_02405, partial [Deltaproteobacteria bacterium]|nr:hypothetical protein [Deltaproteobacteria bacterium]
NCVHNLTKLFKKGCAIAQNLDLRMVTGRGFFSARSGFIENIKQLNSFFFRNFDLKKPSSALSFFALLGKLPIAENEKTFLVCALEVLSS